LINKNATDKSNNKQDIIDAVIDLFHQISDPNTKKAIYYRYFHNKNRILNYSEIAEILKVTPQTVLNWHNKFIKLAKKKLTNKSTHDNI
jgi:DNA-directed RNA polymerase specialized sigma subunit